MTEREQRLLSAVRFIKSEVAGLDVLASKAGKVSEARFFGALADFCTAALRPYDQPFDGRDDSKTECCIDCEPGDITWVR